MSIRITELDAITSLQDGDYVAIDNESNGTHKFKVLDISSNVANNIANNYSSNASYAIGQYCLYNNNLYKCTTTISTPEAWNASHWVQVTVGEGLYDKVDKINGKELSTNDFTNAYKTKLDGIEDGAEVNVQANWTENDSSKDDYIKNKPENATTSTSGFMSASDKQKLDGIEAGAEVNVQPNWAENDSSKDDYIKNKPTIDTALSTSSDNAVRNSAITAGINTVQNNLNAEITARENAVSAEQTARENADNALDGRIDTIEEILPNKANINGSYEEMTVGSAEQLISTESMEDSELYIFRKSGNGADIGDRETDMLVGGTVGWNQLVKNGNFADTSVWTAQGGSVSISDNTATFNSANGNAYYISQPIVTKSGHKYFASVTLKATETHTYNSQMVLGWGSGQSKSLGIVPTTETKYERIFAPAADGTSFTIYGSATSATIGDSINANNVQLIDLTAMFGTEIADYIYSLEQANAGDGVAWFRKYFPKPYYAYNAGSLQSVNVASHDMTGFNQWDEEWELGSIYANSGIKYATSDSIRSKNYIEVMPNTTYYFKATDVTRHGVFYYDADKQFIGVGVANTKNVTFTTPVNCHYLLFNMAQSYGTTYKGDICINISDANRNGEYEEYVIHSYPYDETVELRGVPQLVEGELKYDGDTYESSGKVTRKYGIVDLGILTWDYTATWGSNTNVFTTSLTNAKVSTNDNAVLNAICPKYLAVSRNTNYSGGDMQMSMSQGGILQIVNHAYSDALAFQTAMSGVYLIYQLATPTEEEAEGFTNPQIVDASGTEEYVDAGVKNNTRDMAIPVGHITQYVVNLRDKLQHLPFLAKEDGDYFVNQTGTQMKLKKVEGYYEDLTVGVADNLSTDIRTNDQTPYLFRTSGGSVDIGDREYINSVVGGTIVWNQLLKEINDTNWVAESGTTASFNNGEAVFTATVNNNGIRVNSLAEQPAKSHKHLFMCDIKGASECTAIMVLGSSSGTARELAVTTEYTHRDIMFTTGATISGKVFYIIGRDALGSLNVEISVKNVMLFDLTQMFGSTIADYIYSLEQANAGAGVAYFRSLFPKPYYDYNAGELLSVSGLQSHDMIGFNMCNETPTIGWFWNNGVINKNRNSHYAAIEGKIRGVPSTTYCVTLPNKQTNNITAYISCFDADGNPNGGAYSTITSSKTSARLTTSANCYSFIVQFYAGDSSLTVNDFSNICINISWDASRDGEYEPYQKWSYPLDSSLELRGVPKLDSNNNLYYNGDTYTPDGTVTRRYIEIDMGDAGWTYVSGRTMFRFDPQNPIKPTNSISIPNVIAQGFKTYALNNFLNDAPNMAISFGTTGTYNGSICVRNTDYTDAASFKAAMAGKKIVYELATPTTESAEPYTNPQIVDDFGTEEYVIDSTIDVPIPVGHDTDYPINLKSKLEMAPDSPDGDGDYIVRQTNGTNEYVPLIIEDQLPAVPSTDGTYTLTVTIANGEATYSWT